VSRVEPVESHTAAPTTKARVRLTGKDAFWLHFTLTAGLVVCCGAFAFELWRALGGHAFSWMYVFEWPLFGAFGIYMWWNLLQGNDRVPRPSTKQSPRPSEALPDQELEAWNRYVRLMESEEQARGRRPG
jgi:hypothetical protein